MDGMFVAENSFFDTTAWAVLKPILLLVLAFIVASIVKSAILSLLTRTKLKDWFGRSNEDSYIKATNFIGKLVYLVVFLIFVPGILQNLGMDGISDPIINLSDELWGYLPNVVAAIIVLWIGFFIARLVRELLIPVFDKIKLNKLQEKAGIVVEEKGKLSNTLAYIVYVIILIPVIIASLQVLDIKAISAPAIAMLNVMFAFIPNVLAALIIVIIGCIVAKLAGNIVESLISASGLDNKLSNQLDTKGKTFVLSKVCGIVVKVVMVVFFVVESFSVLHLAILTNIGNTIISYMPYALAAVLIVIICYVCDSITQKALHKNGHATIALVCRVVIYTVGAFMILSELAIAKTIVDTTFIIIVAALAIAFALSFGIGGRAFAGRMLEKLEKTLEEKPVKKTTENKATVKSASKKTVEKKTTAKKSTTKKTTKKQES